MFKKFKTRKILSSVLSLSLIFSCIQIANAKTGENKFLESIKSVVSSRNFIVPAAVIGAISTAVATPCIYNNVKYGKPRNPIENNIIGITNESEPCTTQMPDGNLGEKIQKILNEMNNQNFKTDFGKIVFLHDYICDHCKYAATSGIIDLLTDGYHDSIYDASGCLLDEKAVCSGIAKAYTLLINNANMPNVECKTITGRSYGMSHAWNIVKINGQWYHVDVTWDLCWKAISGRYRWFMLSEDEIKRDHTIDK